MGDQITPSGMEQLEEASHLGPLVGTYSTRVTSSGILIFWTLVLSILLVTGGIVWFSSFLFLPLARYLSPFIVACSLIITSLFPLIYLFFILFFTLRGNNRLVTPIRRKIVVSLHARGFSYRQGRQRQIVPWERIRFIQRRVTTSWPKPRIAYVLQLTNGSKIILETIIDNIQELGQTIEHEVTQRHLPQALADYQDGKPVVFPGLCITRRYISNSDKQLPWSRVASIAVSRVDVVVKEKDAPEDWLYAPILQFPNPGVLEDLLIYVQQEQGFDVQMPL